MPKAKVAEIRKVLKNSPYGANLLDWIKIVRTPNGVAIHLNQGAFEQEVISCLILGRVPYHKIYNFGEMPLRVARIEV